MFRVQINLFIGLHGIILAKAEAGVILAKTSIEGMYATPEHTVNFTTTAKATP